MFRGQYAEIAGLKKATPVGGAEIFRPRGHRGTTRLSFFVCVSNLFSGQIRTKIYFSTYCGRGISKVTVFFFEMILQRKIICLKPGLIMLVKQSQQI